MSKQLPPKVYKTLPSLRVLCEAMGRKLTHGDNWEEVLQGYIDHQVKQGEVNRARLMAMANIAQSKYFSVDTWGAWPHSEHVVDIALRAVKESK